MEQTVTIEINGCTVIAPAEDEQTYREALAEKWIDGCRVYVKDQKTVVEPSEKIKKKGMSLDTMEDLLIEEFTKVFALDGRLTRDYNVNDSLFVYDEGRKVIHSTDDETPIPVFEALVLLCTAGKWKNRHNSNVLHNMFPSLTHFQFAIVTVLFTNECEDNKQWEHRAFLEEFGVDLSEDEMIREIENLKEREILLNRFDEGPDGSVEYLRLNSHYELYIKQAGTNRILKGEHPFGIIEVELIDDYGK